MGGGDLNSKKSWHPNTMKNQERVWKAEQAAAEEKKRMIELQRERAEERDRAELNDIMNKHKSASQSAGDNRLAWMYDKPDKKVEQEAYLLGKALDKAPAAAADGVEGGAMAGVSRRVVGSSLQRSGACGGSGGDGAQVDMSRKLREDPLLQIRERERAARAALLNNPLQRRKLALMLRQEQDQRKESKAKKKPKKKDKNLDDLLAAKLNALGGQKGIDLATLLDSGDSSSDSDEHKSKKKKKKHKRNKEKSKKKKKRKHSTDDESDHSVHKSKNSGREERQGERDSSKQRSDSGRRDKSTRRRSCSPRGRTASPAATIRHKRGASPSERGRQQREASPRGRRERECTHTSSRERERRRSRSDERDRRGRREPERDSSRRGGGGGGGLSEAEKAARLAEMAAEGAAREADRERRVAAQRRDDASREARGAAPAARLASRALPASLESRIHSTRHYIQRDTRHMNEHFARR